MEMKTFLAMLMGLLSFLFGSCSKPRTPRSPAAPEITAESDDGGFVDLGFAIRSRETLPDGSQVLHAIGLHRGREVGMAVVLGNQWKAGSLGPDVPLVTYRGTVTYRSLGATSDALLQALDELYGTRLQPTIMRQSTTFTGISLGGEPADLMKGPVKIKLFLESDDEARYAELYTNIDVTNGILQIHEKDPEYRSAIIKALRPE
jgi:hypothetical protein